MNVLNEMKVENVTEDKDRITVITTGAKYIIEKSGMMNDNYNCGGINYSCRSSRSHNFLDQ